MSNATADAQEEEEMQFGSEGDQNSVDAFEKQMQQQELELQSVLRQQEQEDLAKKAAESTNATSAVPEPVAAPAAWQESSVPEATETTNGVTDQTKLDAVDGEEEAAPTTPTALTVGVKRSSPSPPTQENGDPLEDGGDEDRQPAAKQRKIDEFAKLWGTVQENPKDFQAWTMLLQHVDQQSELESGRDSYAAFFARYPYCYGYWKKFADLEKRKGTQESTLKVFEQGLAAIPLSVDLWVHYLDYITHTFAEADQEDFVRKQFDRAVEACGLEFRSDKMWDAYINWENPKKRSQRVTAIYDKLLATPVAKYMQHWSKFQDHIKKHSSAEVISVEEFLAHRRSLRTAAAVATEGVTSEATDPDAEVDEAPPGVEDDADAVGDATLTVPTVANEEENKSIQQLIISAREKVHQSTSDEVKQRWSYEDAIKRPYFHVKPLERSQLQAWRDYLEFESKQGNEQRTRTLFERCLIAAALYEEFWMRYLHYLETLSSVTPDEMRGVYERACTIHLKDKLKPHLSWANFEEENGNANRALELLAELQSRLPESLEPHLQAVALERRRGNLEKAQELFESSLAIFKEKADKSLTVGYGNLLIKYARFLALFRDKSQQAVTVLQAILDESLGSGIKLSEQEQQSLEAVLWAIIEFALACSPPDLETAASVLKTGTGPHFSPRIRLVFGHRYHQFVAECGHPGVSVSESTKLLRDLQQELRQLESAQEDSMDETLSEKAADNASNSSDHRREKRSGGSKSYSSHNSDKSQQQQQQQQQNFPPQSGGHGHQQNGGGGGNMGGGGGGGYNQSPSGGGGGGGGNNYQHYPPQAAAGGAPPSHQPPQHPPPQGQHQGYGGYNQNYQQQGYPPQQYQGWGYPQHQGGYGYNQQGWPGYPNYYGQR